METRTTSEHSLISLIRELRDETTTLVRQEVALAKAEMSEKMTRMAKNAVYIALGAALAYAALGLLLLAVKDLLTVGLVMAGVRMGIAVWLSPLIIALVIGLIAWFFIAKGKKALSQEGVAPEKTIQTLREDQHWVKQRFART